MSDFPNQGEIELSLLACIILEPFEVMPHLVAWGIVDEAFIEHPGVYDKLEACWVTRPSTLRDMVSSVVDEAALDLVLEAAERLPSVVGWRVYAKEIKRRHKMREARRIAEAVVMDVRTKPTAEVDAVIDVAVDRLRRLREGRDVWA